MKTLNTVNYLVTVVSYLCCNAFHKAKCACILYIINALQKKHSNVWGY